MDCRLTLMIAACCCVITVLSDLVHIEPGNSSEIISRVKQSYSKYLGYKVLLPHITGFTITPELVEQCAVTGVKKCYKPLAAEANSTIPDVCYVCTNICERLQLADFDYFDWIATEAIYNNTAYLRYTSVKSCVNKTHLRDGTYGLLTGEYTCEKANNNRIMNLNYVYFNNTWKDGSQTNSINGTLSLWFHLTMGNLYQDGPNSKCTPLDIYTYTTIVIFLQCNQEQTNMDLYMRDATPTNLESSEILLRQSVLNSDPTPAKESSIHIAHAINTVDAESVIFVDGKLIHSLKPAPKAAQSHRIYGSPGLSGTLHDFRVYQLVLSQRLINELKYQRHVEVTPTDECYCPLSHPLIVPNAAIETTPWEFEECAAVANASLAMQPMDELFRLNTVNRIVDISYSPNNLVSFSETSDYWISGEGDQASIKLSLNRFYRLLEILVRVQTLPKTLIIKTQQEILRYTSKCDTPDDKVPCLEWSNNITIYTDLLMINLNSTVMERDRLRTDRLEIILEGQFNNRDHSYVMKGIEIYADCGCMANTGSCEVNTTDRSDYTCVCKPEYYGDYCEKCSDTYTAKGITCVPCDCNPEGAISQSCDPNIGTCKCKPELLVSEAGPKCNPYFDAVSPTFGPLAGGTLLKLNGSLLNQIIEVSLGGIPCNITRIDERSPTKMFCMTGEATPDMVNGVTFFKLTIAAPHNQSYNTSSTFIYHNNPNVTTMSRATTFYSGGLEVIFGGRNLQGVDKPILLLHIVCTRTWNPVFEPYEQDCVYDPAASIYRCHTPDFNKLSKWTSYCESLLNRTKRQADEVQESAYVVWPGLKLDGYTQFNNLTEASWLDIDPMVIEPDPVIYNFTDENFIKVFRNVDTVTPILIIEGENLNMAATVSDYQIQIGKESRSSCIDIELTNAAIKCTLRSDLPPATEGGPSYGPRNQTVPLVKVKVGSLVFHPGYIYYDRTEENSAETTSIIAGIVTASIVACIAIAVFMFCYKRQINERNRQRELEFFNELDLEATNSLQTQVQSILIEENLNEPLLAHLIPASFVTQEAIIGQGHFGQVYRGRIFIPGRNINKCVAIKSLKPMGLTPQDVINFVKEALLMKDFNHMNVLQLIGIVYEPTDPEGLPLVLTPLMEKGDLKTLISDAFYEFSAGDLLHFGLQVAGGMAYLSNRKFIHRDLRAANCMVDATYIVKVGDFGLSHDISESDYYRPQDKSKPLPVKWMAIEVLSEHSRYTTQSDVWSFGVLLWELMTRGYQPYADVHNSQIKNHIMNGHRLDKPEFIPDTVYDIMTSCWVVEPDARPNFDELTKTISDLLRQADGSVPGYQKNYTSPLASVDYMNPQSFNETTLDDWSTIIPLIKNFGEDYADTGRVCDDADSDDSEPENTGLTQETQFNEPRIGSLNQQLQRMNATPVNSNDYGRLLSEEVIEDIQVERAGTVHSIQTLPALIETSDDERAPEVPSRNLDLPDHSPTSPRRSRPVLESESTIGGLSTCDSSDSFESLERPPRRNEAIISSPTALSNRICDTLSGTNQYSSNMDQTKEKLTAEKKLSSSSNVTGISSDSTVYEEALEVKCPRTLTQEKHSDGECQTNTTFGLDGYLEFEAIQSTDRDAPKPETTATTAITTKPKRPPTLQTQLSAQSLGENRDSRLSHKLQVKKSMSAGVSTESVKTPKTPKINLLTKVPVKSISASSSLDASPYDEAFPVWRKPGNKKVQAEAAMPKSSEVPNARSNITSDGYLEFNAIELATENKLDDVKSTDDKAEQVLARSNITSDGYLEFNAIDLLINQSAAADVPQEPERDTQSEAMRKSSKPRLLKRQGSIDQDEMITPIGEEVPFHFKVLGQKTDDQNETSMDSLESGPKPVARITPMSRDDYDMVIPAPARNSKLGAAAADQSYINKAMILDDGTSYINVQKSPRSARAVTSVHKPPVPQARFATLPQNQVLKVATDSAESANKTLTIGRVERQPITLAPSPNTRRRTVQEALNAKVPEVVDSQKPVTDESTNIEDIPEDSIVYDPDYENMCSGEGSLYENIPMGINKTGRRPY